MSLAKKELFVSEHMPQFPRQSVSPSEIEHKSNLKHQENKTLSVILGLLFLLPALGVVIFTFVVPIFRTIFLSFQDARLFKDPEFIGLENYQELLEVPFLGEVVIFTLVLILTRVVLVLIPPFLLALGAANLKTGPRKIIRVISSIPWAIYSPSALGITWLLLMNPMFGFANQQFNLANPDMSKGIILFIDGLSFFGLACGLGLTVYLSALMDESKQEKKSNLIGTMLILAAVMVISTTVLTLQSGSTFSLITNNSQTLSSMIVIYAFSFARMGMASAIAAPVLLITIILGISMTLLMILTNFRIFSISANTEPVKMPQWLKIISIILMVIVLIGVIISVLPHILKFIPITNSPGDPIFDRIGRLLDNLTLGKVLLNTWLAPLVIVFLVQFPVTFLAALGIGAFRPFGKASEWLLLLFAPWLLVTPVLLIPGISETIFNLRLANRYLGLALPFLVNLPMLFILTFLTFLLAWISITSPNHYLYLYHTKTTCQFLAHPPP